MCGRYTLSTPPNVLAERFGVDVRQNLPPRYNIAPTQGASVVRATDRGRELALLRWGLIPSWAKDPAIGNRMINARAEGVAEKPAFRRAFAKQRALVPADGFYEWQKQNSRKQPYHIRRRDGEPFAFAGLWERWHDRALDQVHETFTIITTDASDLLAPIHNRMPVILSPADYDRWLDPEKPGTPDLLTPYQGDELEAFPVSTRVNSPAHDDARCVEPQA